MAGLEEDVLGDEPACAATDATRADVGGGDTIIGCSTDGCWRLCLANAGLDLRDHHAGAFTIATEQVRAMRHELYVDTTSFKYCRPSVVRKRLRRESLHGGHASQYKLGFRIELGFGEVQLDPRSSLVLDGRRCCCCVTGIILVGNF
jgi:hypothetical protein